jgi:hypothetical protein
MNVKAPYEKPEVEIVEFVLEDSIAESAGPGVGLFENIWGPKE